MIELTPEQIQEHNEMVVQAQAETLEVKVNKALEFLRFYQPLAKHYHPDGLFVGFSGGKDSIVLKDLVFRSGIKAGFFYSQTTIDPPEVVRFIQEKHPDVQWLRPGRHLIRTMVEKGKVPPTRGMRWCCSVFKEQGGKGYLKCVGVRAAESPRRKSVWRQVVQHVTGPMLCPILYWTDADVWEYIKSRNLPYPTLYDEGFTRLGCVMCPLAAKKNREMEAKRWPGFARLWFLSMVEAWNKWKDIPNRYGKPRFWAKFKSPEELWVWWMQDKEAEIPCQYGEVLGTGVESGDE